MDQKSSKIFRKFRVFFTKFVKIYQKLPFFLQKWTNFGPTSLNGKPKGNRSVFSAFSTKFLERIKRQKFGAFRTVFHTKKQKNGPLVEQIFANFFVSKILKKSHFWAAIFFKFFANMPRIRFKRLFA